MSGAMSHVLVETRERVCRIELARPEKRNALTLAMYAALGEAIAAAEADPGARAVLLHGARDCFCSGNDVKDFLERPMHGDDSPAFRFLRAIAAAKKPIVALVGGPAIGIGTTMLLHCDLVYATPAARFQLPFVQLALVPEAGSSLLLPMLAGYQRAAELLLLGRPFDADKALAAGIVTEIIPESELLEYGREAALALAALPPASLRLTKELMKRPRREAVAAQMNDELRLFGERLVSPEAREAMNAFMEKRKPDFSRFD